MQPEGSAVGFRGQIHSPHSGTFRWEPNCNFSTFIHSRITIEDFSTILPYVDHTSRDSFPFIVIIDGKPWCSTHCLRIWDENSVGVLRLGTVEPLKGPMLKWKREVPFCHRQCKNTDTARECWCSTVERAGIVSSMEVCFFGEIHQDAECIHFRQWNKTRLCPKGATSLMEHLRECPEKLCNQ